MANSGPVAVSCETCGAGNELPPEALRLGRFRCHACGAEGKVPDVLRQQQETPAVAREQVQTGPSFVPSEYNTPEALHQAEVEATRLGCLVALLGLFFGSG